MTIQEKLFKIQQNIKVQKTHVNEFGNFNYRSAEDIEAAVKPFLAKAKCVLKLSDDIVLIGDRYYIKATASIVDFDGGEVSTTAFAREQLDKPKMDQSQVTGSASSYARKYALSGLFALDNEKDADTMDNRPTKSAPKEDPNISVDEAKNLEELIKAVPGKDPYDVRLAGCLKKVGVSDMADLKQSQYQFLVKLLQKASAK